MGPGAKTAGSEPAPGVPPTSRRKTRQAANAARRERHRLAEERLAAERAQRRADNQAARERDAASRAERQRVADVEREQARVQEEARRQAATARERPAPTDAAEKAARAAERGRKRREAAERRAERKTRQRRAQEEAKRAEREAVRTRARGTDPYAILGVTPNTTAEEVDRAYRRLARAHHPDLHRDGTPQERAAREAQMKRVNAAYSILGDVQRRSAYDRVRRRS
jgi:hypothetical protein